MCSSDLYSPALGKMLAAGDHELSVTFTPNDTLNYTIERSYVTLTVKEKLPVYINWEDPSAIAYGTELSDAQLNATTSVPGTFVYSPSAGHILAPGSYKLLASFTPSDTEKFAPARSEVMLEVQRTASTSSSPATDADTQYTWTYTAVNSGSAHPAPSQASRQFNAVPATPRETRKYKGVVYEKGDDGQWHIQKN